MRTRSSCPAISLRSGCGQCWLVGVLLAVAGCHHVPLATPVRDTPPLDEELAARLRPTRPGEALELDLVEETSGFSRFTLRFRSHRSGDDGSTPVAGEYYRIAGASAARPAPLLQIAPILGGAGDDYALSRIFAGWAAAAGLSAFFLLQEETILDPDRDGAELEMLLRRTTVENIQALGLLAALPEVDGDRLGSFGISMGAIKNVLLAAAEPRLRGNILCLAGGDFARIVRHSRESMVLRYLHDRARRTGWTREAILADLAAKLISDPIHVARHVDPSRVILVLGSLDDKVPYATGLALHRALGRPELHVFPVGHYTAMVLAPYTADVTFGWLKRRFDGDANPG